MRSIPGSIFAYLFTCWAMVVATTAVAGPALAAWERGRTPALSLADMKGIVRSLDEFRGKVVVINFWATWCEPCVEEMPSLQKLRDRHAHEEFAVIGVNLAEGEARIRAFVEKTGTTFPILLDRDGAAKKDWKVNGVPATFVLDATGRIRFWHTGVLDFADETVNAQIVGLLHRKAGKTRRGGKAGEVSGAGRKGA